LLHFFAADECSGDPPPSQFDPSSRPAVDDSSAADKCSGDPPPSQLAPSSHPAVDASSAYPRRHQVGGAPTTTLMDNHETYVDADYDNVEKNFHRSLTTVVRAQNHTSKTANITDTIFDRTYW